MRYRDDAVQQEEAHISMLHQCETASTTVTSWPRFYLTLSLPSRGQGVAIRECTHAAVHILKADELYFYFFYFFLQESQRALIDYGFTVAVFVVCLPMRSLAVLDGNFVHVSERDWPTWKRIVRL